MAFSKLRKRLSLRHSLGRIFNIVVGSYFSFSLVVPPQVLADEIKENKEFNNTVGMATMSPMSNGDMLESGLNLIDGDPQKVAAQAQKFLEMYSYYDPTINQAQILDSTNQGLKDNLLLSLKLGLEADELYAFLNGLPESEKAKLGSFDLKNKTQATKILTLLLKKLRAMHARVGSDGRMNELLSQALVELDGDLRTEGISNTAQLEGSMEALSTLLLSQGALFNPENLKQDSFIAGLNQYSALDRKVNLEERDVARVEKPQGFKNLVATNFSGPKLLNEADLELIKKGGGTQSGLLASAGTELPILNKPISNSGIVGGLAPSFKNKNSNTEDSLYSSKALSEVLEKDGNGTGSDNSKSDAQAKAQDDSKESPKSDVPPGTECNSFDCHIKDYEKQKDSKPYELDNVFGDADKNEAPADWWDEEPSNCLDGKCFNTAGRLLEHYSDPATGVASNSLKSASAGSSSNMVRAPAGGGASSSASAPIEVAINNTENVEINNIQKRGASGSNQRHRVSGSTISSSLSVGAKTPETEAVPPQLNEAKPVDAIKPIAANEPVVETIAKPDQPTVPVQAPLAPARRPMNKIPPQIAPMVGGAMPIDDNSGSAVCYRDNFPSGGNMFHNPRQKLQEPFKEAFINHQEYSENLLGFLVFAARPPQCKDKNYYPSAIEDIKSGNFEGGVALLGSDSSQDLQNCWISTRTRQQLEKAQTPEEAARIKAGFDELRTMAFERFLDSSPEMKLNKETKYEDILSRISKNSPKLHENLMNCVTDQSRVVTQENDKFFLLGDYIAREHARLAVLKRSGQTITAIQEEVLGFYSYVLRAQGRGDSYNTPGDGSHTVKVGSQ